MMDFQPGFLLNAAIYALVGLLLFLAAFAVLDRLVPYPLWKKIVEEHNVALAVVVGALAIGMAIIIASAVH